MKKLFILLVVILIVLVMSVSLAALPSTEDAAKGVGFMDTVNVRDGFNLNGNWIFEGNVGSSMFKQKKYFLISNPKVYILAGNSNLAEKLAYYMPFGSPDSFEGMIKNQNFANILGVASGSESQDKVYGSKTFYEFTKDQEGKDFLGNPATIHSILDFYVEGKMLYSFSYNYIGEMEDFEDYTKALANFKTNEEYAQAKANPVVNTTPVATTDPRQEASVDNSTNITDNVPEEQNTTNEIKEENTTNEVTPTEVNQDTTVENPQDTNEQNNNENGNANSEPVANEQPTSASTNTPVSTPAGAPSSSIRITYPDTPAEPVVQQKFKKHPIAYVILILILLAIIGDALILRKLFRKIKNKIKNRKQNKEAKQESTNQEEAKEDKKE